MKLDLTKYPKLDGNVAVASGYGMCTPQGDVPEGNADVDGGYANYLAALADGTLPQTLPLTDKVRIEALENRYQAALAIPANGGRVDAALAVTFARGDIDKASPVVIRWENAKQSGFLPIPDAPAGVITNVVADVDAKPVVLATPAEIVELPQAKPAAMTQVSSPDTHVTVHNDSVAAVQELATAAKAGHENALERLLHAIEHIFGKKTA